MKSNNQQLKNRGYITDKELDAYRNFTEEKLFTLLKSKTPDERTAAIKLLSQTFNDKYLPVFCNMLVIEKKLYTKIALCESIESYGNAAIPFLIPLLGKIGRNQHKEIGLIDINKKSFPLPRDIIARILIRLGPSVLSFMRTILNDGEYYQKLEAIDVIGHIAWNYCDYSCENLLIDLYHTHINDSLLKWKIVKAFQSFNSDTIIRILETIINKEKNKTLKKEAERSLNRIQNRK